MIDDDASSIELGSGIRRLLRPESVAIVGASEDPSSIGGAPLAMLERFGYRGEVHLVSRSRERIGQRRCLGSIDELPAGVDAAVLAIPRGGLLEAVEAAGRRKIGGAVVFASGYGELGPEGRAAEQALAGAARRGGIALAGPNCLGFVNFIDRAPLTFAEIVPNSNDAPRGIAVIAQSGALSMALTYAALAQGISVTHAISTGNEAVLSAEDYLAIVLEEERTAAVVLLIEQIRRPQVFAELARRAAARGVALCLLHTGRSERAQRASLTHTGALAGDHAVIRAALSREGVLFIDSLDELIDTAGAYALRGAPRVPGIAFMTDSGAAKTHAIDVVHELDAPLAELAASTLDRLREQLPSFATAENPVDITAMGLNDPSLYARVAQALLDDPSVGTLMVAAMPGSEEQGTAQVAALVGPLAATPKPVVYTIMGGDWALPPANVARIRESGAMFLRSVERGLCVAARLGSLAVRPSKRGAPLPDVQLSVEPGRRYHEAAAKALLRDSGIRFPHGVLATTFEEVEAAVGTLGVPVMLKVSSPQLLHKSDIGALVTLRAPSELRATYDALFGRVRAARPELEIDGVLVEQCVPDAVEMIVGARRDPSWGPYVVVGLGGIWTNALGDRALVMADAEGDEIDRAISQLKGFPLLSGARGKPPADLAALGAAIQGVAAIMRGTDLITELEINPLAVLPPGEGAIALDALIITAGGAQ